MCRIADNNASAMTTIFDSWQRRRPKIYFMLEGAQRTQLANDAADFIHAYVVLSQHGCASTLLYMRNLSMIMLQLVQ